MWMSIGRFKRAAIIGFTLSALGLLAGCSMLRVTYGQGPQLAHWWLDNYVGFNDEQNARVKEALTRWFAWHRATQLDDYGALLADMQLQVMGDVSAARLCRLTQDLSARLNTAVDRALPAAAELAPSLTAAQIAQIEKRYLKSNAEIRDEFLQARADERQQAATERAVERFESIYGRLDEAQKRLLAERVKASPFNAETWIAERVARQQEVLRSLRRLAAEPLDRDRTTVELKRLASRFETAASAEGRAYQQRVREHNCEVGALVHNSTTAAQRRHARDKFKGWETDLRQLAAAGRGAAATASALPSLPPPLSAALAGSLR
jgi:Family of unknown function (DUF6279)